MANLRNSKGQFSNKEQSTDDSLTQTYQEALNVLIEINKERARGKQIDDNERQAQIARVKALKEELKFREEQAEFTKKQLQDSEDMLSAAKSMQKSYQKLSQDSSGIANGFKSMLGFVGKLGVEFNDLKSPDAQKAVDWASKAMAVYQSTTARAVEEFKKNNISAEQLADRIGDAKDNMAEFLDELDDTNPEIKKLKDELEQIVENANKLPEAFAKAKKQLQEMKSGALGELSKMPMGSEIGDVLKSGGKAGLFALGAAGGAMAMKYFGAEKMARIQAEGEIAKNRVDTEADVAKIRSDATFIPEKITEERNKQRIESENEIARLQHEAGFAAEKSAIAFSSQLQMGAAEFRAASKTALFGKGLGSIAYGAAEMQLAGISAETVAEQLSAASSEMGKPVSAKMASDMSVFAKRTGQSAESVAGMTDLFMRLDGSSAETALNMQEGLYALAESAKVDLGGMMRDIAEASKEALGYQIKSGPALAKQVAYSKSIGVSFNEVAKAGKGMVLNYKDSIKSEMQLSALLGKQVDLSEVRQKFATGDTAGALEALKAQGLDPAKMNMFQQQALQEATGMDLDTLQKVATREGRTGELGAGNVRGANQQFLSATKSAQAGLAATQASISAQTAVLDAQLSQKIADGYLASDAYKKYQQDLAKQAEADRKLQGDIENKWLNSDAYINSVAAQSKIAIEQGFKEAIPMIMAGIAGGALTSFLGNKLIGKVAPKAMGFVKNLIPGLGSKTVSTVASKGASASVKSAMAIKAANPGMTSAQALKQAKGLAPAASLTDDVAKVGLKTAAKGGFSLAKLGTGLLKGGVTGVLGTATSMAGDYFGGQRVNEGIQEADAGKVMQGRAMKAGATAVEYAGYGAAIGSIIPGLGTAVGGAIGGVVGGVKGIFDNWFSDSAKAEDEALKKAEADKKLQEDQKRVQEQAAASTAELEKQFAELGLAAQDEGYFRSALLAQLVEATRLLDILAFASEDAASSGGKAIYLDGALVTRQLYNKAQALYNVVTPTAGK